MQGDKVTLKTTTRTDLEIHVVSASKDAYAIAWTSGETRFDDPGQAENPLIQRVANLLKGYRIILELDSRGAIKGVQNWNELREASVKLLDALADELKAAGIDRATVAGTRDQVASMFETKQQIEQLATREAQLFFMPLGIEFKGDKPVEFEDELPNPFGGAPFPSRARFALKEVDSKHRLAKVTWTQTVASEDARRIMEKTLKELAQRMGKAVPDADLLTTLTLEDAAEFSVELSSGWIQSFTHRRVTKAERMLQEDLIAVTRKKN
jgi:hypothetical protein